MQDRERLLAAIARDQRGVFTLRQAEAVGFSARTIRDRVRRGTLERVHSGVYGFPGGEETWHRSVKAAVLSSSGLVAASHSTAAHMWGMMSRRPDTIETVLRRHRRVQRPPFVVHESKDLLPMDVVDLDGIAVTTPVRTIVDLGASAPSWLVERCLDDGLRRELFTAWDVRCFIARVARSGRNGIGTIRPLIEERLEWATLTDSTLEDLFRSVVTPLPVPAPDVQFKLFDTVGDFVGRFDFAYEERLAFFETDSIRWHMDPVAFERDREKQNRAHALGWTVYRITWRQLLDDPESVRRLVMEVWTD